MKDLFEVRFETKMTVGAATPKLGAAAMKVLDKALPYLERIAEAATKDFEHAVNPADKKEEK